MYRDVARSECDQIVLVSNDSDIVPALEFIRKNYSNIVIGSIMPRRKIKIGKNRVSNKEISGLSNWTRQYVLDTELENTQLPDLVPTRKKSAYKPDYW